MQQQCDGRRLHPLAFVDAGSGNRGSRITRAVIVAIMSSLIWWPSSGLVGKLPLLELLRRGEGGHDGVVVCAHDTAQSGVSVQDAAQTAVSDGDEAQRPWKQGTIECRSHATIAWQS
jgi:hypothetical protein